MVDGVRHKGEMPHNPVYPPDVRPGYEPPNVHDGYNKFIGEILDWGNCDSFQGPPPKEDKKWEERFHKFLKWSGIAFAVAMGLTILKKAIFYTKKAAPKVTSEVESVVSSTLRHRL